jgi:hypothetical protein
MPSPPAISVDEICRRGRVGDEDVTRLRRLFCADTCILEDEARAIIRINRACSVQTPSWIGFYREVIGDFLLDDLAPQGYLTTANAAWLIDELAVDGTVTRKSDIELLVSLLDRARWSPESLIRFALAQVERAVVSGTGPLRAAGQVGPRTITESDVELVRRLVYAFGGDGNIAITRAEADVLFAIEDATAGQGTHPDDDQAAAAWSELFVKAIANSVLAASGYAVPSREEALSREAWLESRGETGPWNLLAALRRGWIADAYRQQTSEERAIARLERQRIEIITNEEVTQGDCSWLEDRLGRDGRLTRNEQLLIAYLARENPRLAPALAPLVARHSSAA